VLPWTWELPFTVADLPPDPATVAVPLALFPVTVRLPETLAEFLPPGPVAVLLTLPLPL